jgi:serine/threonine protein kinase
MPAYPKVCIGSLLDDRFLLTEEIAHGGMAVVFKAKDLLNCGDSVAVKVPKSLYSYGIGNWSMCQQEETIGRSLNHPYVLKFLPLSARRDRCYMVTEYVSGPTLAEHLKRQSPLPQAESLSIASRVCEALHHVHEQGYVHYDLKPANIILCPDGAIRLIDFGLSHRAQSKRFSFSGQAPGLATADYVAPEQVRRKKGQTSADVYGVGAILYEMLTGQVPFPNDDPFKIASTRLLSDPVAPRALNAAISHQAEEIVLRAMRRNPAERYASVAALRHDLDHPEGVAMQNLRQHLRSVSRCRKFWHVVRHVTLVAAAPILCQIVLFIWLRHHFSKVEPHRVSHPTRLAP